MEKDITLSLTELERTQRRLGKMIMTKKKCSIFSREGI